MTASAAETEAAALLGVEHSATGRRWRSRVEDERLALALAQQLDVPEIVGRVLAARGVVPESAENFLDPKLRTWLPDPSSIADMDLAARRLASAIKAGEGIAIFGDYDVDGATSAALLQRAVTAAGGRVEVYIPDRLKEGYGPNLPALLSLQQRGAAVVVTVDCGTTAFEVLEGAADAGLDVVVVDHHIAEPRLPRCTALVNPNRLDDSSGQGRLAAVGVAFLLAVALNRELRRDGWFRDGRSEMDLRRTLDMVALGTVCDVVPLTGLNRAFVAQGLKVLAQRGNVGLAALADAAGVQEVPGAFHLGFLLGPRINAGGRVGQADLGAQLLVTENPERARRIALELNALNLERRAIEAHTEEEAYGILVRDGGDAAPVILVAQEGWHAGVIGIVASRLVERYRRPAFVLAVDAGLAKGSGRSIPGVDLGAAVIAARQADLLINGGGHPMAAGVTVATDKLEALRLFLTERLAEPVAQAASAMGLGVDGTLSLGGATRELLESLSRAGPFGAGNPEPRFVLPQARLIRADLVGESHVRCILGDPRGKRLKGIAFRVAAGPLGQALLGGLGRSFHVAGHLRADDWRGRRDVQFAIDDVAQA